MNHHEPRGKKIRSIIKPTPSNPMYNFPEFPKDEPGVIYVRQSTIAQQHNNIHSFEMQTDKFIEYFREQLKCTGHIEIIADDEGVSGTKDIHERAGLTRVIRLVEGKELLDNQRIGWIGAIHVNRLTRDRWLVTPGTIMKECYEHNVWIATLRMNFNFQDEYCRRVFMIEAEESARHLEWMKLVLGGGRLTASNNGYYDGRWIAPGYIVDRSDEKRKKYILYEPHAVIIRWLFRRFFDLDGDFPQLCKEVAEKSYLFPAFESWVDPRTVSKFPGNRSRKRGSRIDEGPYKGCYKASLHGLKSILTNPVYIGWWLPIGGGVVENNHPAIVDGILFIYAHKRLSTYDLTGARQRPERVNRAGEGKGILKKVLYDDESHLMYVHFAPEEKTLFRYRSLATGGITAPTYKYSVEVTRCDQIFLEKLFERIQILERLDNWHDKLHERLAGERQKQEEKKNLLRKQIDHATRQRAEILETLADPDIPKSKQMKIDYANQAAGLEGKIHKWKIELADPAARSEDEEVTLYQIHSMLPDIKKEWSELSFAVQLRFVGALVSKIVLTPVAPSWMKIEIYWKSAMGNIMDVGYMRRQIANGSPWTEEEDAILRQFYPQTDASEILQMLPGRTWSSIHIRAYKLKVTRELKNVTNPVVIDEDHGREKRKWTLEEDSILREKYPQAHPLEILELLGGRTWQGVIQRASKLGVLREVRGEPSRPQKLEITTAAIPAMPGSAWTQQEDDILREFFHKVESADLLKLLPGRTLSSAHSRADYIGLPKTGQKKLPDVVRHAGRARIRQSWEEEENAILREMYPEAEPEDIMKHLPPHRTWNSVRKQASTLKIARKHGKTPNSILISENMGVTVEDQKFEKEIGLISNVKNVQWLV